ncbi:MAG: VCBS repeat-containing protein [Thermoplasmatales archaeon]|nr:VCBS repeat-containing protein [Thermoplasmatales archaeon]
MKRIVCVVIAVSLLLASGVLTNGMKTVDEYDVMDYNVDTYEVSSKQDYQNIDVSLPCFQPSEDIHFLPLLGDFDFPGRSDPFFDAYEIAKSGQTVWGLTSADFNDDGWLDFAASSATCPLTHSTISIFYNDGNGRFTQEDVYTFPDNYITDLDSGDYDNDGDIDFLVGDNSGLVSFYKNDGTGVFDLVDTYDFGERLSKGITSSDFDNDGDIDFIVTQQLENKIDGCIYLVGNDGSQDCFNQSNRLKIADLPPTPSFFAGPVYSAGCLQSIDYNNDGKMDFLFSGSDTIFLFMQQEKGGFDYFSICRLPAIFDKPFQWLIDHLRSGGMTVGDYNGDGLDDIMVGGVQGFVRLFTNQYVLVDIIKPDQSCVFVNDEIKFYSGSVPLYSFLKHGTSIVIGDIIIVAKELQPLSKVEFYLGKKLVFTDEEPPFEWEWNSFSFGRHVVKAIAYDLEGNKDGSDTARVWKFL